MKKKKKLQFFTKKEPKPRNSQKLRDGLDKLFGQTGYKPKNPWRNYKQIFG